MGSFKEAVINLLEYAGDWVTYRARAIIWAILDSSAVGFFVEKVTRSWGFLKNLVTFRIRATTREAFDSPVMKSFTDAVTTGSKAGTRQAAHFSRKYVSLTQAGAQATQRAIIAGRQQLPGTLRRRFIAGLQVMIPIGVTLLILAWFFSKIDNILQPIINLILGHTIPGLGFGITVLLILLAGVIVGNVVGRKIIHCGESVLSKIPIVSHIYNGIKQILESFSSQGKGQFMQVVLVEFPTKGMRTLGFVTNEAVDQSGKLLLNIFIPTAPNPTSGFLQIIPAEDVIRTSIPVDDALKMIISAGRVSARGITERLSDKTPGVAELESLLEAQVGEEQKG